VLDLATKSPGVGGNATGGKPILGFGRCTLEPAQVDLGTPNGLYRHEIVTRSVET